MPSNMVRDPIVEQYINDRMVKLFRKAESLGALTIDNLSNRLFYVKAYEIRDSPCVNTQRGIGLLPNDLLTSVWGQIWAANNSFWGTSPVRPIQKKLPFRVAVS